MKDTFTIILFFQLKALSTVLTMLLLIYFKMSYSENKRDVTGATADLSVNLKHMLCVSGKLFEGAADTDSGPGMLFGLNCPENTNFEIILSPI